MKFSRIVFVMLLPLYLISCHNDIGKKGNEEPKKNTVPSTEYQKTEKAIPKLDRHKPVEKPFDKEVEPASPPGRKKKLKAIDTLKPVVAIP